MKRFMLMMMALCWMGTAFSQDWKDYTVPANPGQGMVWELQEDVSDDFNYNFEATSSVASIGNKWSNFYHNGWTGPAPTVWKRDHVFVEDGKLKIKASRTPGVNVNVNSGDGTVSLPATNLGCITSTKRVIYPVYVETFVKITKSVLASDVWMLSPDDTQEIDICEAYGSDRWTNDWFSNKRLHLSHHVFIRSPFQDWQPSDAGSFYTDGVTQWRDNYHRIGVYWKDPWNLEYYVDGKLVRTRSGKSQIDPNNFTNGTGLSKEMDIIINTEDQSWRALQGLSPTDVELENTEDHTFKVDWVRVYKPVTGEAGPVTGVMLDKTEVNSYVGASFNLTESVIPNNANDVSVSWSSDKPEVASVSSEGLVECKKEGVAIITVTTNENNKTASCTVTVSKESIAASLFFDNESKYLNTDYVVGEDLQVSCNFHAGTGNTVVEGGAGGVKFWLREIKPGWNVANDYVANDVSAIGQESGTVSAKISLTNVPATAEIPAENWYFLFVSFKTSDGKDINTGIYPITIKKNTALEQKSYTDLITLIPDHSSRGFRIQSENQISQVGIFHLNGAMAHLKYIDHRQGFIPMSHLRRGIYLIQVQLNNGIRVHRKLFVP